MNVLEKAARAAAYSWAIADDFDEDEALVLAETDWRDWVGPARAVLLAVRFRDADALHNKGRRFNREIDAILKEPAANLS